MPADFYDLLEVDEDASESEIKRAYRDKATRYHPDVNDDPRATDQFATLNKARDVLTDSKERARYDRLGHRDYVSQHLDGLPTMTRPGQNEEPDAGDASEKGPASEAETEAERDGPEYGPGTGGSGTARNRTRSKYSGGTSQSTPSGSDAKESGTSSGSRSTGSESTTNGSSTGGTSTNRRSTTGTASSSTSASSSTGASTSGSSGASTGASSGASRTSTRSTTAGSPGAATGTGSDRSTRRSTSPPPSPRRVGLRRGWIAATVALVLYLAGLGAFATVAGDGVTAALAALQADPVSALAAPSPLADPVTVALAAVQAATAGQPTVALLVPLGLVALPLTVTVSVVRFGQGTAYLYGAGVVVPLVWVVARTAVPAPLGADLAALVAVPLLAALWFLVDVGRFLRA